MSLIRSNMIAGASNLGRNPLGRCCSGTFWCARLTPTRRPAQLKNDDDDDDDDNDDDDDDDDDEP